MNRFRDLQAFVNTQYLIQGMNGLFFIVFILTEVKYL